MQIILRAWNTHKLCVLTFVSVKMPSFVNNGIFNSVGWIKDFSLLFHSGISEKLSLWVDLSEFIFVFNYLGFFPKLTLVFHVSWYVSLSPGIVRQLQTSPVVFPFLYQTGEMLSDADYLGPAFHVSLLELGIKLAVLKLATLRKIQYSHGQ